MEPSFHVSLCEPCRRACYRTICVKERSGLGWPSRSKNYEPLREPYLNDQGSSEDPSGERAADVGEAAGKRKFCADTVKTDQRVCVCTVNSVRPSTQRHKDAVHAAAEAPSGLLGEKAVALCGLAFGG